MPLSRSASISPGVLVLELRAVIAMLQSSGGTQAKTNARSVLRLIEGGLSRACNLPGSSRLFWLGCWGFSVKLRELAARALPLLELLPRSIQHLHWACGGRGRGGRPLRRHSRSVMF